MGLARWDSSRGPTSGAAILFVPGILGQLAVPILSDLNAKRQRAQFRRALRFNLLVNGGSALAIAAAVAILSPLIMRWFGKGFRDGWPASSSSRSPVCLMPSAPYSATPSPARERCGRASC